MVVVQSVNYPRGIALDGNPEPNEGGDHNHEARRVDTDEVMSELPLQCERCLEAVATPPFTKHTFVSEVGHMESVEASHLDNREVLPSVLDVT